MATRAAAETGKAAGGGGCFDSAPVDQCGFRSAGRTLFPQNVLVLGHRHCLYFFAVHPDGPGPSAALSWLCEGETVLETDRLRLHQHGLPPLLSTLVVLALVLLVVGELLVSQKGAYPMPGSISQMEQADDLQNLTLEAIERSASIGTRQHSVILRQQKEQ